nr:hypothetical protein [Tanacetum cinerariifolium]
HTQQEVKNIVEQVPKCRTRLSKCLKNFKVIHTKSSISLNNTSQISSVIANTPNLPTEEPEYSLSMRDEHLSIISETESNEVIKSRVKNLVPIPSESEVTSDNENTLIDSSPKFDYLLEEFSGELAHIDPILSGIKEADFDLKEEFHLVENLLYDNSSPLPPKELNSEIADTIFDSLSPSPILVEDSDSQIEEIDLFLATDDLMPPGIENDDYDSEEDIYFLKELLSNDSFPLSKNESSNFDHHDDPSFPRPPLEPPDVKVFFEPDSGVLTTKVVKVISEHYVLMPNILPTLPTLDLLYLVFDTLLSFSSKNEDKFNDSLSLPENDSFHFDIPSSLRHSAKPPNDDEIEPNSGNLTVKVLSSESPMMIYEGNIPILDVPLLHFYPP